MCIKMRTYSQKTKHPSSIWGNNFCSHPILNCRKLKRVHSTQFQNKNIHFETMFLSWQCPLTSELRKKFDYQKNSCMIRPVEFLFWADSSFKPILIFEHFTIVRCCLWMMSMVFGNDFSSLFAFTWFHFNILEKKMLRCGDYALLLPFFIFEMSFIYVIGNHCKWGVNLLLYITLTRSIHRYSRGVYAINLDGVLVKRRAQILLDFVKSTESTIQILWL